MGESSNMFFSPAFGLGCEIVDIAFYLVCSAINFGLTGKLFEKIFIVGHIIYSAPLLYVKVRPYKFCKSIKYI